MRRPKLTIGVTMAIVAAFAVAFAVFRGPSEKRAVEIATRRLLKDLPGSTRPQVRAGRPRWDSKRRRWEIAMSYQACFSMYYVDWKESCSTGMFILCG